MLVGWGIKREKEKKFSSYWETSMSRAKQCLFFSISQIVQESRKNVISYKLKKKKIKVIKSLKKSTQHKKRFFVFVLF